MTQETQRYINTNAHFPGGDFEKIKQTIIGKRITRIEKKGDFQATVTLDGGTMLYLEGNEGGCGCGNGDWAITKLLTNGTKPCGRIMNAWIDNQIKEDVYHCEIGGPITLFVMAEGCEYPLVEFNGYDNGCYGQGFYCRVTRVIPPEQ